MNITCIKKNTIIKIALILVTIITSTIILSSTKSYAVFYGKSNKLLPIYYVETSEKKVALTFDCAWGVDYTDILLQTMAEEKVQSTFFMVEFWVEKHPDYVKKISEMGHEIGTHSSTHPYMSKLSKDGQVKELSSSTNAIESITNKKVNCFRAPYGDYNDSLITTATELSLYTIQWDVDSLDWKDLSQTEIENRVLNRVKNGSIVLFHNQGLNTHKALKKIITELKAKGYTFCTVYDLIYKSNYKMGADGAQIKNN